MNTDFNQNNLRILLAKTLTGLLRKIDNYGTTERKSGSGRPRSSGRRLTLRQLTTW